MPRWLSTSRRTFAALLLLALGFVCAEPLLETVTADPPSLAAHALGGPVVGGLDISPPDGGPVIPASASHACACAQAVVLGALPHVTVVLTSVRALAPAGAGPAAPPSPLLERELRPPATAAA